MRAKAQSDGGRDEADEDQQPCLFWSNTLSDGSRQTKDESQFRPEFSCMRTEATPGLSTSRRLRTMFQMASQSSHHNACRFKRRLMMRRDVARSARSAIATSTRSSHGCKVVGAPPRRTVTISKFSAPASDEVDDRGARSPVLSPRVRAPTMSRNERDVFGLSSCMETATSI